MSMLKLGPGARELTGMDPKDALFVIQYLKDCDPRRAAIASGYEADEGYKLLKNPEIMGKISHILSVRLELSSIDAEWALGEAVDNHHIARQMGNITASNTSLGMIMKHKNVNAFAAEKIEVKDVGTVQENLLKSRARVKRLKEQQRQDRMEETQRAKDQKALRKQAAMVDTEFCDTQPPAEVSFL